MSDTTYNGWTNRETWAVALHVNNDQGWQEQVHELVSGVLADQMPQDEEHAASQGTEMGPDNYSADTVDAVADAIAANVTAIVDPLAYVEEFGDIMLSDWVKGPGLAARDIGDLDNVNWHELAESFISDVKEQ